MKVIIEVVCIIMFVFNFWLWVSTEEKVNESCSISSAIYYLCFILVEHCADLSRYENDVRYFGM